MKDNSPLTGNTGESPLSAEPRGKVRPEVFVIGGIHQSHEGARFYTYERLGELFDRLAPDLLCVEVLQRHLDDGTDTGMPRDFRTHMVPRARAAGIPVVGIDWWHDSRGEEWRRLQAEAGVDPALAPEVALLGGMFGLLNDYFRARDFREVNAPEVIQLWMAKTRLKFSVLGKHPRYAPIGIFENERNARMVDNVLRAMADHPARRVLVAVGIDHKGAIEHELGSHDVQVLDVNAVIEGWCGKG